ncbi:hypothetical protein TNIN_280771 [Trichonephila inaurata madagascariensis]|uniref:Uncharacterized protein n=1 Tax=Trichonephila inaurata madagascariensis TaxID=2747483 RepID=A0A8X6YA19_9ARAC|nr:hypothetical protein TNIN_280771 [Trichonephila inaurata madagascariensis]
MEVYDSSRSGKGVPECFKLKFLLRDLVRTERFSDKECFPSTISASSVKDQSSCSSVNLRPLKQASAENRLFNTCKKGPFSHISERHATTVWLNDHNREDLRKHQIIENRFS